jgi:hypothetical protein
VSNERARSAKSQRVRDALAALYDKLAAQKAALPPAARHAASQQLRPLLQALDAAFEAADRQGLPPPPQTQTQQAVPQQAQQAQAIVID